MPDMYENLAESIKKGIRKGSDWEIEHRYTTNDVRNDLEIKYIVLTSESLKIRILVRLYPIEIPFKWHYICVWDQQNRGELREFTNSISNEKLEELYNCCVEKVCDEFDLNVKKTKREPEKSDPNFLGSLKRKFTNFFN